MQKEHKMEELLNIQQNANQTHNGKSNSQNEKPLIEDESLPGTPFHVRGNEETGYFLRLGNNRMTEHFPTKEDAINELYGEQWNMITKLIVTVTEQIKILHTQNEKQ